MLPLLIAAAAAAAAPSAPKAGEALPPFTTGYEPSSVDERGLWMDSDEAERRLRDSTLTVKDEALSKYLHDVLCRTVGADRCKGVRIYVVEVPAFNASMYPNGMMTVWTGMLLRVRNEAELASVLSHEFAHFELRHSLMGFKQRRKASDIGAWVAVLGGFANTDMGSFQYSLVGSMFQFNREQEEAADLQGFHYLAAANYPTKSASQLWQSLMDEEDARAVSRGQKPKQRYGSGFFDSHPTSLRRSVYLDAEAQKIGDTGRDARPAELRAAMDRHLPQWLEAQIKLNDFGGTEYILQNLSKDTGWTGELLFARGELYRLRGNPRDMASSVQFYQDAVAAGYSKPIVHRNLGMSLLRTGKATEGRSALSEYLRLMPEANDAKAVQTLIAP